MRPMRGKISPEQLLFWRDILDRAKNRTWDAKFAEGIGFHILKAKSCRCVMNVVSKSS